MAKDKINKNSIVEYLYNNTKSFDEVPFNNVDSLVLSQFSYADFKGIVPTLNEKKKHVLMKNLPLDKKDEICRVTYSGDRDPELLNALVQSPRFGDVKLCLFVDDVDLVNEYEFSVITFILNKKEAYIAFRGTASLLGWKEDFNMSFMNHVPSHYRAKEYINKVLKIIKNRNIYIGGHSKGGNIACYAAANVNLLKNYRVKKIYLHDSPGFRENTISKFRYNMIKKKIDKTIPTESIIGMLLKTIDNYKIVNNTRSGIMQHDSFSWIVIGNSFSYAKKRTKKSFYYESTIEEWIYGIPDEKRKLFVDNLYQILEISGAKDIWDLPKCLIKSAPKISKELNSLDKDSKKSIQGIILKLSKSAIDNLEIKKKLDSVFKNNK